MLFGFFVWSEMVPIQIFSKCLGKLSGMLDKLRRNPHEIVCRNKFNFHWGDSTPLSMAILILCGSEVGVGSSRGSLELYGALTRCSQQQKFPGFASAWDFWDMDMPDFRIFLDAKSEQHLRQATRSSWWRCCWG